MKDAQPGFTLIELMIVVAIIGKYVTQVTVENGVIDVEYGGDAHAIIAGMAIQLTPITSSLGSVAWDCASAASEIENKHLPSSCRQLHLFIEYQPRVNCLGTGNT